MTSWDWRLLTATFRPQRPPTTALAAVTGLPIPIRDYEAAIELTYRWELAENWSIEPDLQYIFHPGSNIANPANPAGLSPIPNALVLGVRTALEF